MPSPTRPLALGPAPGSVVGATLLGTGLCHDDTSLGGIATRFGSPDAVVREGHVWNRLQGAPMSPKEGIKMATLLWILAVILVIWGIVTLVRGSVLMGIVLIIVGLLVGPGGVSIFG